MTNAPGRPSKACGICKKQKIRCSGERPSCKRCVRLKNTCYYDNNGPRSRAPRVIPEAVTATGSSNSDHSRSLAQASVSGLPDTASPDHDFYHGIAPSLVSILVELYFENVYQSDLLLHKDNFLNSLANRNVKSHVLLSICAWGATFYQDESGKVTLKEQGLMTKWAKKAGALVFQEAEELSEDNLVTFCNLSLFWHSQGSWRISYLHKGNACQLLHIVGTGSRNSSSFESEILRRRFWTCYLFHCFSSEKLFRFEAIADIETLPLPWPEDEFAAGVSRSSVVTIGNKANSSSIFAELIRGLHLWCSVVSAVRSDADLNSRLQEIFRVENEILGWWRAVPSRFKLDASSISISQKQSPKILLTNLVYHQSLCAVHSSIVPLFCWSRGEKTYSSARQLSAQVAFEHAGAISGLIIAVLNATSSLSAMPLFVAYAAYSSCAVQIPFLWCSETSIRSQAHINIEANIKVIQGMSHYWKLASLLNVYVRCLHDVHKRNPPEIPNEPKYTDASIFTNFEIDASLAKASILEFTGILRSDEYGFVKPGEETRDPTCGTVGNTPIAEPEPIRASDMERSESFSSEGSSVVFPQAPNELNMGMSEWPTFDVFNSLFDADMTSLLPLNDNLDLSFLATDPVLWDVDGMGIDQ